MAGYEVQVAGLAKEGVHTAREFLPDLVLCDIQLPDMDGYGVLQSLRNTEGLFNVIFILMTGVRQNQDFRRGMDYGADDFLIKPFSGSELLSAVNSRFVRNQRNGYEWIKKSETEAVSSWLSELPARYPITHFKKNAQLYHVDQKINFLFYLQDGLVRTSRTDSSGKELTTSIFSKGKFIGLADWFGGLSFREDAHSMSDLLIMAIPVSDLRSELGNSVDILSVLSSQLASEVSARNQILLNMAYQDLRGKVAYAFLRLNEVSQTEEVPFPPLPITRVILATIAGIAKESAVRTVLDLIDEELLEETDDGFRIVNKIGLEKLAQ